MRLAAILLAVFWSVCGYAQTTLPKFHRYSEKYIFLDTNTYLRNSPYLRIADTLKKMEKMAEDAGDNELASELKLFTYTASYHSGYANKDTVEQHLLGIAAEANTLDLRYLEADALQSIGDFYGDKIQQQSAAIDNYIAAYTIYRNFTPEEFPAKQRYTATLGGVFYRYEDYENAIIYLQNASHTKQSVNNNQYCSIFNTIGLAYRHLNSYDSAIVYFQKTLDTAIKRNDSAWMGISQGNIGITYFYLKRYAEAIPLLEKDINLSIATTNIQNAVVSLGILATIYNDQRDYGMAEKTLTSAFALARSRKFWSNSYNMAEQLYTQMSRVSAAKKNYQLAYLYADSAMVAKDSLASRNNKMILAKAREKQNFIQHKLESEKLRSQVKIGLLEIAKKRILITFTFVGIAILLLVVVFIARERRRSEDLLLNILPEKIADRLKRKEHPIADYFDHASILFIDMAGFTLFSDGRDPKEIVNILNTVFTRFDMLAEKHGLEKIKTIGDCYMAVSGIPEINPEHAEAATQMALEARAAVKGFKANDGTPIQFRIGLDCGPVVAGVIGRRKFIYDLWGDTVNMASRMESTGVAGEIHCTDRFKKRIEGRHTFLNRGQIEVKGKGMMETWLIID